MLTPVLFVSWSHVEMCSFSTLISLWKRMMNYWVRHVEKESIISICHILSSSLVQFHPVALSEHLLIWSYLQLFSQDCCELTCPHPIFPYHFAYMFLFPIPTLPRIPVFAKVLPSTAPFLAGHPTRPRRQRLARAPRTEEGPSTAERLRPRPKKDPWKFLPLGHQWDLLSLPTFTSNTWFA